MNNDKVSIEWSYEPKAFFEEVVRFQSGPFQVTVDAGKIVATASAPTGESLEEAIDTTSDVLEAQFRAQQLVHHEEYKLSKPSESRTTPEGRRIHYARVSHVLGIGQVFPLDFIQKDSSGQVIYDSRQERIANARRRRERAAKFALTDKVAAAILASYSAAVADPSNELVHLAEIKGAISSRFGSEHSVPAEIQDSWKNLKRLANREPLKQGRHRGEHVNALRDATAEELETARREAAAAIDLYLKFLEEKRPMARDASRAALVPFRTPARTEDVVSRHSRGARSADGSDLDGRPSSRRRLARHRRQERRRPVDEQRSYRDSGGTLMPRMVIE